MKVTAKDSSLAVLDEIFEPDIFKQFWDYFNGLEYAYRSSTAWHKVWRINDGQLLASLSSYHSKAPFGNPMDWIDHMVTGLAAQLEDVVGVKGKDWNDVIYTPYIYPAGTKISWHNDSDYTGACIFYPHPEWNPYWGGELFVAKTPSLEESKELVLAKSKKSVADTMTRGHIAPILDAFGMGHYIAPLPNRMVFTSGNVWHAINRVDPAAGDNVRCSIAAFFLPEKIS